MLLDAPFPRLSNRRTPITLVFVMQTFHAEIVVGKDGKLHLDDLPFSEGESVHVFVSSATPDTEHSLEGSVLKYDQPLSPVAEEEWEAAK